MTDTTTATTPAEAPAARLQPGGRRMQLIVTVLLAVVAVCALADGAPALVWAGGMAGLPGPMRGLTVAVVDGVLVVMSLAAVTRRGRGEHAMWMWLSVGVLAIGSAAVQAVHALTVTPAATLAVRLVAAGIGALPPAITVLATHGWLDLAVAPPPGKRRVAGRSATATRTTMRGGSAIATTAATATTANATATTAAATAATVTPPAATATPRRSVADPGLRERAMEMVAGGATVADTVAATGATETSLRRWLRAAGITPSAAAPAALNAALDLFPDDGVEVA